MTGMSRFRKVNRLVFDLAPAQPIGRRIYSARRQRQTPAQSTATKFFRNLDQLTALEGPLRALTAQPSLRVLVAGCSMGCEAYTLGAYLAHAFTELDWRIEASDISEHALEVARTGVYGPEHGLGAPPVGLTAALLERLLIRESPTQWRVREDIAARIAFGVGDVLNPGFAGQEGFDVVFGQNFMIHMSAEDEAVAFANLVATTRPGGVLFLGGMDLDRRPGLVAKHGLLPVDWNLRVIHNADEMRRSAWPWDYWSLEPFNPSAPAFLQRYATIFQKP